jgi:NAD(P)-dependent dehydrogenase (short-subunit alcohol dehydrogenase family)
MDAAAPGPPGEVKDVMDLSGKVAIITGSGQGLGLAYAKALAAVGAAVVVNDVNAENAEKAAAEILAEGGRATAIPVAVGTTEAAQALVEGATGEFGRLDIIVTNAGILRDRVLWNMSDEDFDAVLHVHLRGTFTCVREAMKYFREAGEGGRVILAGSPAGQRGNFGQTNYAAAKAGIAAMARTWAMECAKAGVTVNAIIPNAATAMTETIPFLAPYAEALKRGEAIPAVVRRAASFGTPEDVAGLVVFLASDAAAGVTGQCIGIGGDRLSLWSHPTEVSSAFLDGGWSADAIADAFASTIGERPQTYGIPLPKIPTTEKTPT